MTFSRALGCSSHFADVLSFSPQWAHDAAKNKVTEGTTEEQHWVAAAAQARLTAHERAFPAWGFRFPHQTCCDDKCDRFYKPNGTDHFVIIIIIIVAHGERETLYLAISE